MEADPYRPRFMSYLGVFTFFMLNLKKIIILMASYEVFVRLDARNYLKGEGEYSCKFLAGDMRGNGLVQKCWWDATCGD